MSGTDGIQQRLGLEFNSPGLLVEALTHPSYLNENPDAPTNSYQRLEFLGDAILGSITAEELFQRYPDLPEGELTRFRSHLVQEKSLAEIASELDLGEYLYVGRGEESSGGRHRSSTLAAALEALIGAVYLDQGADVARALVMDLLGGEIARAEESGGAPLDPKSHLQEMVQAKHGHLPCYRVVNTEGPDHKRIFTVEVWLENRVAGVGTAQRKLDAEREAASMAIEALGVSSA